MKKILITLIGVASLSVSAATFSTNILDAAAHPAFVLLSSHASVYQVELTASQAVQVDLYDMDIATAPYFGTNYTNAAFVGRGSYSTNLVTTFVGANGYTNYTTNVGVFTYSNYTAAATNVLPKMASFVVGAGAYAVYNADALFIRGITAVVSTNVSITINYRPGL